MYMKNDRCKAQIETGNIHLSTKRTAENLEEYTNNWRRKQVSTDANENKILGIGTEKSRYS